MRNSPERYWKPRLRSNEEIYIFPLQVDFEASNLTQVPLQPSCPHSWFKPYPLSNELAVVMDLGQWLLLQSKKLVHRLKWRPYMAARSLSKCIHTKEERNGLPSASQGLSTAKPRGSHATWAECWNPPTSPCPTLSTGAEPKSQGYCQKWHHNLYNACIHLIAYNWLTD